MCLVSVHACTTIHKNYKLSENNFWRDISHHEFEFVTLWSVFDHISFFFFFLSFFFVFEIITSNVRYHILIFHLKDRKTCQTIYKVGWYMCFIHKAFHKYRDIICCYRRICFMLLLFLGTDGLFHITHISH